jgi:predicted  nucleic acid-binding Zn-ribbon protein
MSAALGLLRLQKVDRNIGQVQSRLEQIQQILEDDAELAAARHKLEEAQSGYRQVEQERRTQNMEAASLRLKIQGAESSLYGGKVRNPKELQDLQADVESLKRQLAVVEERELVAMIGLDAAQGTVAGAEQRIAQLSKQAEADHARLHEERSKLTQTMSDLCTERDAAVEATPPDQLQRYNRLLQSRRGVAVAEIVEGACAACGTALTAALQQNARHASELTYCPSCGRILFAD